MVVLDGHNMMGNGPNQYIQPDYLSPLPTTLDAKKSPLALLAQTCSQIGNDSPTKSLLSLDNSNGKRKSSSSSESSGGLNLSSSASSLLNTGTVHHRNISPCSSGTNSTNSTNSTTSTSSSSKDSSDRISVSRPRSSSSGSSKSTTTTTAPSSSGGGGEKSSPAFKPYEPSFNFSKLSKDRKSPTSPLIEKPKTPSKRPPSDSPIIESGPKISRKSPNSDHFKKYDDEKSSPKSNENGASPIIRSGLDILQNGGLRGSSPTSNLSNLSSLSGLYPPGFDPTNPALRPPFFAPPTNHQGHHNPFLGAQGFPQLSGSTGMPPYVSYTRVKNPSGAESIVPVCKDPYCTGCNLSMPGLMANAMVAAAAAGFPGFFPPPGGGGGICPAGCVQCDHQKFAIGLPSFFAPQLGLSVQPNGSGGTYPPPPPSLLSQQAAVAAAAAATASQHSQRPYICNWIVGESYCGKRFPSSEELLQHLRTHTNTSGGGGNTNSTQSELPPTSLYSSALLSSSMSAAAAAAAAMHRTYPTPPLSPLSAARYNPYAAAASLAAASKPGGTSGYGPTSSLVPHPQSLVNYYSTMSPYAMYGGRIGPPIHP